MAIQQVVVEKTSSIETNQKLSHFWHFRPTRLTMGTKFPPMYNWANFIFFETLKGSLDQRTPTASFKQNEFDCQKTTREGANFGKLVFVSSRGLKAQSENIHISDGLFQVRNTPLTASL